MKTNYTQIQNDVVSKYRVTLDKHSKCKMKRAHAHVSERRICNWNRANTFRSTFTLLHEIGHLETTKRTMKRCESEYYATCWALDKCKEYNLYVDEDVLYIYQRYIYQELARGKRRGGKKYDSEAMNLYAYIGRNCTVEEFKEMLLRDKNPGWAQCINPYI